MWSWLVVLMMVARRRDDGLPGADQRGAEKSVGVFESSLVSFLVGTVILIFVVLSREEGVSAGSGTSPGGTYWEG
jgi:hypothetical protein